MSRHLIATLAALCVLCFGVAAAQSSPFFTGRLSNVAVGGYDPVSYFDGTPQQGDRQISRTYRGAAFRFANQENLERFSADPEAYVPQYGGYCAWAVAQGSLSKGDPRYWAIVGGKLYLNYDEGVQALWDRDRAGLIETADANWPEILDR